MEIDLRSRQIDDTKPCEMEPGICSLPNDSPPASEVDQIVDLALGSQAGFSAVSLDFEACQPEIVTVGIGSWSALEGRGLMCAQGSSERRRFSREA